MKEWKRKMKRMLSMLLALAMVGNLSGMSSLTAYAAGEEESTVVGLCEHHTEHTAECGYTEEVEGTVCTFSCDVCGENGNNNVTYTYDEYQPATLTKDKYDIDGDSIKDNVYEIGNAGQLYWFAGLVNGTLDGVAQDKYANAVLTEDIIVNSGTFSIDSNNNPLYNGCEISETNKPFEWVPIGIYYDSDGNGTVDSDESVFYYGTFDGNNHTVSGLYLNASSQNFVGLFGRSADTVKNVGVINSYFNGNEYVGGVCGSGFEIINCYNKSIVSGTESVGGVCGFLNSKNRSIVNCYNTGVVLGTEDIGGVCGYGDCVIVNCYNTGNVTGSSNIGEIYGYGGGAYANNYYLADSDDGKGGKTAAQFASGEVAYLLSQGCTIKIYQDQTFSGKIWGQTLSGDSMEAYPVLNGKKVYYGYLSCAENATKVYTNDSNASDMKGHTPNVDDGDCTTAIICSKCKAVTMEAKESHTFVYTAVEASNTIQAACDVCSKSLGTITLTAPENLTYSGSEKEAAVSCTVDGVSPVVVYTAAEGCSLTGEKPVKAGTYTARITMDSASVAVEYTITPKQITLTGATIAETGYNEGGEYTLCVTGVIFDGVLAGDTLAIGTDYTAAATLTGANEIANGVAAEVTVVLLNKNYVLCADMDTVDTSVNIVEHSHNWTYTTENTSITAVCDSTSGDCTVPGKNVVVTLLAPDGDMNYDGTAKTATASQSALNVLTPVITYNTEDGGAPVEAGTYTAYMSLGEGTGKVTVSIEFTIFPTYTVIYTDGLPDTELFEDQVYTGLVEGAATPKFQGELIDDEYEFMGWHQEIASTVTEDITYKAVCRPHRWDGDWQKNSTHHWHECLSTDPECQVTENSNKSGYGTHTYASEVTKQPTVDAVGERTYTCEACGYNYTEEIEKLEPTPTPTITPIPTVPPTATVTPIPTVPPTATVTPIPTVTPTATVTPIPTVAPGGGGAIGGGGSYYPSYPVVTPMPVPTAAPTEAPSAAPTVAPTVAPGATPVPGTTTVPSSGETVVDEKGDAVTSVVREPGTTTKLSIPGLTDGIPEEGEEAAPVIWGSSNPDVAEVDEDGNITMKKPGLAEIVVTVGEGEDAKIETIVVLVEEPRTYVNPLEEAFKDVRLGTSWGDIPLVRYQKVGETVDINFWGVKNWKLDNYEYIWKTSDESVAVVDDKGRVTALKPGAFELTLGLKNKADGHFLNVQSVEMVVPGDYENKILLGTSKNNTFDSIVLNLNERIDINFYGVKNWKKEDYEYHWSSSEPSVVWVDNLGRLTPVNPGKAEIFLVLIEKKNNTPRYVIPMEVTVPEK